MDESRKPTTDSELVGDWVEAIEAARKQEKDWRDEAGKAVKTFRGEKDGEAQNFNIYHSNIEIVVPSLFNSMPAPDVRRRFNDDDPVARYVADIIERSLSYSADAYGFDQVQSLAVYDMVVPGRGVTRVRYLPETDGEKITAQKVTCENTPYDRFIRGPAVSWEDVPWIAFEHFLPREEVEKLSPDLVDKIPFNYSAEGIDDETKAAKDKDNETPKQFQRAQIYEIWDKRDRKVTFICPDYKSEVVKADDDPLGLEGFFPVARPMHAITPVGTLVPVCSLTIYRKLLEELNDVSRRIAKLVKQLRPRGGYAGTMPDIKSLTEADDGELVALTATDPQLSAAAVDVSKWIAWFPLEPTVLALRELLAQREALVQQIYQVTGMSDIMRGATDPRETMGAQQLKAQFGSVRIRSMQGEVHRHVRDTFRLKAEIIAKHFEWPMISEMTNIKLLPQAEKQMAEQLAKANPEVAQQIAQAKPELAEMVKAPSVEEVMQVLRSGMMGYRIDIETDSTIRADMMRAQEQMNAFIQGTAAYMGAMGPAVKEGAISGVAAVELYKTFTRQFNLGKSAEDALEKLSERAEQQDGQPNGQAAGEAAKAQADAKAKTEGAQIQAQSRERVEMAKLQQKTQSDEADRQLERENEQLKAQLKAMELQLKAQSEQAKQVAERDKAMMDAAQRRDESLRQDSLARQQHVDQMFMAREDSARQDGFARQQHADQMAHQTAKMKQDAKVQAQRRPAR